MRIPKALTIEANPTPKFDMCEPTDGEVRAEFQPPNWRAKGTAFESKPYGCI